MAIFNDSLFADGGFNSEGGDAFSGVESFLTKGLVNADPSAVIGNGQPLPGTNPPLNSLENPGQPPRIIIPGQQITVSDNLPGQVPYDRVDLGDRLLQFDDQGRGLISPPLSKDVPPKTSEAELLYSYTGSDMKVMLQLAEGSAEHKELIEVTTLTVSVHRVKIPVRACGYINPKGIARGSRTIAGTIILTQFGVDILYRFLNETAQNDNSLDSFYQKPDQIPPFNLTLLFTDEYGNASYRRLLGVEPETDGTVYSIQDLMTEQSISYRASDFTPLLPVTRTSLITGTTHTAFRTVRDARAGKKAA